MTSATTVHPCRKHSRPPSQTTPYISFITSKDPQDENFNHPRVEEHVNEKAFIFHLVKSFELIINLLGFSPFKTKSKKNLC